MRIDITSNFGEAIKFAQNLQDGFSEQLWADLALEIEKRARESCNDSQEQNIKFHFITNLSGKRVLEFKAPDVRGIDCVLRAIRDRLGSMPLGAKTFYQATIGLLENKKRELNARSEATA